MTGPLTAPTIDRSNVIVKRSARRTRTVSAHRRDGQYVVSIPDRFTAAEEAEWVAKITAQLQAKEQRRSLDDDQLLARASALSQAHLPGSPMPSQVRWVTNQNSRWGSTTPATGVIRISHRLSRAPEYVLDYVLVHELAHLIESSHNARFWKLVARYPHTERAKSFLEGVSRAAYILDGASAPPEAVDEPSDPS